MVVTGVELQDPFGLHEIWFRIGVLVLVYEIGTHLSFYYSRYSFLLAHSLTTPFNTPYDFR